MAFAYKDGFIQKMESRSDISAYNTHHAWILFSSICLFVATNVNNAQTGAAMRDTVADFRSIGDWFFGERGRVCDISLMVEVACLSSLYSRAYLLHM